MATGNLAGWLKKEGDAIRAGDVICRVETDKATVDYEAQEAGVLGKILVKEGATDVPVGTAFMILVDDARDVAAFANWKPEPLVVATPAAAPAPAKAQPSPPAAKPPTPAPAAKVAAAAPTPAVPAPPALPPAAAAASTARAVAQPPPARAAASSPLAPLLAREQHAYHRHFGSTLFAPLLPQETASGAAPASGASRAPPKK
jgi:pyruvate dehydrogenase E2 component (dihydrolipoamide acetyltransferase)